ncbi:M20 family metallopeptidase [Halobacillus massiliensis]|uniref:M20 family metallopeptidase n=1 Tax=Halobacillus massiliensis TaxID=1926286 RepID=UPI0009E3CCB3|nr:M20 family metallopeptidase [Halobacillus massiliensis]
MQTTELSKRRLRDRDEVISLTKKLVQIPSVYRPGIEGGNEEKAARFAADYLRKLGIETHVEEVVPGRPNVIGVIDSGKPGRTLLFEGHTDVVTEGDHDQWDHPPFSAEIVEGKMYGRGTNDTKGNLACMITAVHSLLQDKEEWSGRIILCIPCDEEGMMIGIKHFIKQGWAKGVDGAVICEPEENQVCITQRGAMRIKLTAYGKMAHGAISWSGINPNWRMARMIVELEKLEKSEHQRLGKHPTLGWPSITPTILQAPVKGEPQINVIPEQCMAALDVRSVPGFDHEEFKKDLQKIIDRLAEEDEDFRMEFEVVEDRPWTETDRNEPIVQSVSNAVRKVMEKEPVYNGVPGATDGTFLHMAGVPIVTIGAGDRDLPHQINEYVEVEELAETTEIYRETALHFLNEKGEVN